MPSVEHRPTGKTSASKAKSARCRSPQAFQDEVGRLLKIGFIRESYYPDWLANPILVIKPNGKWRMFIDFTNLNKACLKDSFPLPQIDQLVDATTRHELLSFMDVYSRYNQIPMYEPDEEHTSFITYCGLYCYKAMPFGLKNVGVLMNMMFKDLIGNIMEVYVNDMLLKSRVARDHVEHLGQMFDVLKKYQMKLNPLKYAFGVGSRKLLSFLTNQRGIEANPEKIKVLLEMNLPKKPKEVMSLVSIVAALSRFVSKVTYRWAPFFDVLKGSKRIEWADRCEQAFKAL